MFSKEDLNITKEKSEINSAGLFSGQSAPSETFLPAGSKWNAGKWKGSKGKGSPPYFKGYGSQTGSWRIYAGKYAAVQKYSPPPAMSTGVEGSGLQGMAKAARPE